MLSSILSATPAPTERKLIHKVEPVYPELAKKNGIVGTVKLRLVIAPDGTIKSAEPVGGHPILIEATLNAVESWKYAAAAKESTVTVEFKFAGER